MSGRRLSRRELVAAGAAALGTLAAACGESPATTGGTTTVAAPLFGGTLRLLGTPDLLDPVARAARNSFVYPVEVSLVSEEALIARVAESPHSFDVVSAGANLVPRLWTSGNLVGLDRTRIELWSEVTGLYVLGKFTAADGACTAGLGDAPFRRMWSSAVHEPGSLVRPVAGAPPAPALTGGPGTFGIDALGYDGDALVVEPDDVSWGELFNARWRGRVALSADPLAGFQEAALAANALGLVPIADPARPRATELDALAQVALDLKRRGQFRAFASSFDQSVDLLSGKEVVIEPLSWPAFVLLRAAGFPARYADPAEGGRAFATLLLVSRAAAADPARLQACYDVINWWHGGGPGSIHMRMGWYNAVQVSSLLQHFVSQDEWDYWIRGLPAATDLPTVYGEDTIPRGSARDGGSISHRACSVAIWRSDLGDTTELAQARWREVVTA